MRGRTISRKLEYKPARCAITLTSKLNPRKRKNKEVSVVMFLAIDFCLLSINSH